MSNLNIKNVMKSIDTRDIGWYDRLSDEEKKDLKIWQIMRYTSSCNSNILEINYHYLVMTNELVNINFNILRHYPDLQYRLLQTVGIGSSQFHPWLKPSKRIEKDKLTEMLYNMFDDLNYDEIAILRNSGKEEIKEFLIDNGFTDKEVKDIIKYV